MTRRDDILDKQLEILTHQKNFNLILAVATIFVVLIYGLQALSKYSTFDYVILFLIVIIVLFTIILLIVLFLFIIKRTEIPSKIIKLFLGKK